MLGAGRSQVQNLASGGGKLVTCGIALIGNDGFNGCREARGGLASTSMRVRTVILAAIALSVGLYASSSAGVSSSAEVASDPARAAQAVPAPGWQIEQIPGAERTPEDVSFDAVGHAMVTWLGGRGTASESLYFGADVREPAGGWHQVPNPPIQSSNARMYLYGDGLVQQIGTVYSPSRDREQVVAVDGSISGTFATPRVLSANGELGVVSAADAAGDAIVAWPKASKPRGHGHGIVVAERTAGRPFSSPRTLTFVERLPLAVGLTRRGERVLVWGYGKALYARIRRPGQPWGPARLAVRLPAGAFAPDVVSVAINPSGTVVLAWEAEVFPCEGSCPSELSAGVALSGAHGYWRSFTLERPAAATGLSAQIVALDDTAGRTYVTWNGVSHGTSVVKFVRVGTHRVGPTTVLSASVSGATLLDAAAGPRNALAVSWRPTSLSPSNTPVYVSLRRNGQPFAAPAQVTSGAITAGSGLVAFQPITGQALVVSGTQAAISPPG